MSPKVLWLLAFCLFSSRAALAEEPQELDPFAPGVESQLKDFDQAYEEATGLSSHPAGSGESLTADTCYQLSCPIFVDVDKDSQTLRLYLNGFFTDQWPVSSGKPGHGTPNFNKHFDGRIYQKYSSTKFPGGDYMGLGNMPYAMFISGGFAIHGTPEGNWPLLGQVASHGCIRIHPENAKYLNELLRQQGVQNSWVYVH